MLSPTELREEAITLFVDADELCFDARLHTSVFPADEWPVIRRRLRERLRELNLRADQLRDALGTEPNPEGQQPVAPSAVSWYRRWLRRRAQRDEPVSSLWLRDLYRRTRALLSNAHEFIEPNGMKARH